jgi:conjugal transfer mating pair stabilization protein TraG
MMGVTLPPGLSQKTGSNITTLAPEVAEAFPAIIEIWRQHGAPDPVITSGNDSTAHVRNSYHYRNRAIDLRGNNVSPWKLQTLAQELQERLGSRYRVWAEFFPRLPARNHIHIEFVGN